jgi:hypothetical protein
MSAVCVISSFASQSSNNPKLMLHEILCQVKTDEMIEAHGYKVLCVLPYHNHFHPTKLIWSQAKRYYNSNFGQNGFGMEAEKKVWEESLEQFCMFVFVH